MSLSLEDRVRGILRERRLLDFAVHPENLVYQFVYAAEHWMRMTDPDVVNERPYLRYVTAGLPNSPFSHLEKHALIFPVTHSFWTVWYPPNDPNCMCTVLSVSESLLQQRGWTVSEDRQFQFPSPEIGFHFNIGMLLQEKGGI